MKRTSILILRAAIIAISTAVLAVCTILLPMLWGDVAKEFPAYSYAVYSVFGVMIVSSVPFFIGMFNAWKLLGNIKAGRAFTSSSAVIVRRIAICAGVISALYVMSMPFFYIWADNDDAPGLVVVSMVLVGAPLVVTFFAALLQRLIQEAVDIKSENELTV